MSALSGDRARSAIDARRLDQWLAELGLPPIAKAERDGVISRDVTLHGRRRRDIRATVILDRTLGCLIWIHYAPPLSDGFRKCYQQLLRWNDALPFAKFGLADDDRITLTTDLALPGLDRDGLGLALARLIAVCDLLAEESAAWIWPTRRPEVRADDHPSPVVPRYAVALAELGAVE